MKNNQKWNKFIGLAAVIVMLGTTFFALSDFFAEDTIRGKQTSENSAAIDNTKNSGTSESKTAVKRDPSLPDTSVSDWDLVLVGPFHKLDKEIAESQLTGVNSNGEEKLDSRIADSYKQMAAAAEAAGHPLVVVSAYRSIQYQEQVFNSTVTRNMSQDNLSKEAATEETKKTVTEPGYSEHHTGLAVDVVDEDWYNHYDESASEVLDAAYGKQPGAKWLAENADKYGFIVRYPDGDEKITGITYEPWHLRYVGVENAKYITEHGLTLEEYLDILKGN